MKTLVFLSAMLVAGFASAGGSQTIVVGTEDVVAYGTAVNAAGEEVAVFQTRDGQVAELVEVGADLVLGVPGVFNFGSIGTSGVHVGAEVLGTGGGVGIGPNGVGAAAQAFGHGWGVGLSPRGVYSHPRVDIGCTPYYNVQGQGYRNCAKD